MPYDFVRFANQPFTSLFGVTLWFDLFESTLDRPWIR
jgi:hypothetical protein